MKRKVIYLQTGTDQPPPAIHGNRAGIESLSRVEMSIPDRTNLAGVNDVIRSNEPTMTGANEMSSNGTLSRGEIQQLISDAVQPKPPQTVEQMVDDAVARAISPGMFSQWRGQSVGTVNQVNEICKSFAVPEMAASLAGQSPRMAAETIARRQYQAFNIGPTMGISETEFVTSALHNLGDLASDNPSMTSSNTDELVARAKREYQENLPMMTQSHVSEEHYIGAVLNYHKKSGV